MTRWTLALGWTASALLIFGSAAITTSYIGWIRPVPLWMGILPLSGVVMGLLCAVAPAPPVMRIVAIGTALLAGAATIQLVYEPGEFALAAVLAFGAALIPLSLVLRRQPA